MVRNLKENWKWWVAIAALGLLPFAAILFSGQILFSSDQVGSYAWKYYFDALRSFQIPQWNPYSLGGMPTFDAMFGDASYPIFFVLGFLLPAERVVSTNFILHVLIAGWGSFFLARRFFRLPPLAALALACAYMLNTNFISHIHAGHTAKFYIMAWLPVSLYCLLRSLQPGVLSRHLVGLALTISLFISTTHFQFTYFVLMGYFLYWAFKTFRLVKAREYRPALATAGKFWAPILLGIGLAFFIFYPPTQYNKDYSVRGEGNKQTYEHATSWSMHPEEAASLVVPEFTGINEHYWGRNPFKLNSEYAGLGILFLGIFGLAVFRKKWMWFWAAVSLLSLVFALGADTPLFHLFYAFIPGIKSFRAPSMMSFWLVTGLWMMAAQTLCLLATPGSLPASRKALVEKRLLYIGLGAAGVLLLFGFVSSLAYGIWNGFISPEAIPNFPRQAENLGEFGKGAVKNGLLLGILVLALRRWVLKSENFPRFSLVLLLVVCADLYLANRYFIQGYPADRYITRDPALNSLAAAGVGTQRVLGLPGAYERGTAQYYKFESVEGFTDNEYRLYRAYRGGDYQQNPFLMAGLKQGPEGVSGSVFLDMLNLKYIAYRIPGEVGLRLAPYTSSLPRAHFVGRWESQADSLTLSAMLQPGFDPRSFAYVSATTPVPADVAQGGADSAAIEAGDRSYNHMAYRVANSSPGLLVLSDLWFPNWRVEVDGKAAPLLRVDYAFRGVALPAGSHDVKLSYHSPWLAKGLAVSGVSGLLLILGAAAMAFLPGIGNRDGKA